jgi:hypothetical protein
MKDPASFFGHPDPEIIAKLIKKSCDEGFVAWKEVEHPQLGTVEVGGFSYLTTIRNPPEALLAQECVKGLQVANNMRSSLPSVHASSEIMEIGDGWFRLSCILENQGFLSSVGTQRALDLKCAPRPNARLEPHLGPDPAEQRLSVLDGWGTGLYTQNPIYPTLGDTSSRAHCSWVLPAGRYRIEWDAGRGGYGILEVDVG